MNVVCFLLIRCFKAFIKKSGQSANMLAKV